VDRRDRVGLGETEQIAVAAQVARVVAEAIAPELGLPEPVRLEHRAHRPVEDEDSLAQQPGQQGQPGDPIERRRRWGDRVRCGDGRRCDGRHDATAAAGCRARIRRTSSAHCS
jgi:hypothetical protein